MRLSVVTALFNGLDYTRAYLDSLLESLEDVIDFEIIFVDDGSSDSTREWLQSLDLSVPTKIFFNDANLGYGRSNNFGASKAEGDVLAFLNNDILLQSGWFEPMLEALKRPHRWMGHERMPGLVGNVQWRVSDPVLDHAGIYFDIYSAPQHRDFGEKQLRRKGSEAVVGATAACWVTEREWFTRLGGFDERFVNGMEDVDFCLQTLEWGRVPVVSFDSQIKHHVSASRVGGAQDEKNFWELFRKWRYVLNEIAFITAENEMQSGVRRVFRKGSGPNRKLQSFINHSAKLVLKPPSSH
ncbi:MAG: glycosyltransferase [Opitutales bacterium]|nr:glycosyltransferase [Opitutales bacterium]NRA26756.1 glycosyltransferase [Opitutales bacterium]